MNEFHHNTDRSQQIFKNPKSSRRENKNQYSQ